jgi:ABC-type nitrate/sulfonate/bicarbonate transport system permease component
LHNNAFFGTTAPIPHPCYCWQYLGGSEGLGNLAVKEMNSYNTTALFAVIIHLSAIGFLFYAAVVGLWRFLIPWHESTLIIDK